MPSSLLSIYPPVPSAGAPFGPLDLCVLRLPLSCYTRLPVGGFCFELFPPPPPLDEGWNVGGRTLSPCSRDLVASSLFAPLQLTVREGMPGPREGEQRMEALLRDKRATVHRPVSGHRGWALGGSPT